MPAAINVPLAMCHQQEIAWLHGRTMERPKERLHLPLAAAVSRWTKLQQPMHAVMRAGYTKTYDYLPGDLRAKLDLQKDGLYLYRKYVLPHCTADVLHAACGGLMTLNYLTPSGRSRCSRHRWTSEQARAATNLA